MIFILLICPDRFTLLKFQRPFVIPTILFYFFIFDFILLFFYVDSVNSY